MKGNRAPQPKPVESCPPGFVNFPPMDIAPRLGETLVFHTVMPPTSDGVIIAIAVVDIPAFPGVQSSALTFGPVAMVACGRRLDGTWAPLGLNPSFKAALVELYAKKMEKDRWYWVELVPAQEVK